MKCPDCKKEISEGALFCEKCGASAGHTAYTSQPQQTAGYSFDYSELNKVNDVPSKAMNVLSFFFPVVGLIVGLLSMSKTPKKAKSMLVSAVIGWVVSIILSLVLFAVGFAVGSTAGMDIRVDNIIRTQP